MRIQLLPCFRQCSMAVQLCFAVLWNHPLLGTNATSIDWFADDFGNQGNRHLARACVHACVQAPSPFSAALQPGNRLSASACARSDL